MEKLRDIRIFERGDGVKELIVQLDGGGASILLDPMTSADLVVRRLRQLADLIENGVFDRIPRKKAPWPDFAGNEIYIGDVIQHPSGQTGTVLYLSTGRDADSQWLVDYGDVCKSRLALQIGDKGRAVVIRSPLSN